MKNLLFLLAVIFMQNTVLAQEKTAKISFKFETIDYGTIAVNSDGIRVFEFTNTGDAPLIITEVSSSCGCTIPKKPEAPILPGKTGEIQVKYNTALVGPSERPLRLNLMQRHLLKYCQSREWLKKKNNF